jgi:hypothetical protein
MFEIALAFNLSIVNMASLVSKEYPSTLIFVVKKVVFSTLNLIFASLAAVRHSLKQTKSCSYVSANTKQSSKYEITISAKLEGSKSLSA